MVKRALLVGINYIGTDNELSGCINDVKNMKEFLVESCEFVEENIILLTDEEKDKPVSKNIKDKIKWLVSNTVAGDTLVFHYSGHGSNVKDKNKDESDKQDESIIPLDFETAGEIIDDWLFENLVNKVLKDVNLYCFFDSCFSGTVIDLKYNYQSKCRPKVSKKYLKEDYDYTQWSDSFNFSIERSKDVVGNVYMFSGCRDNETSADAEIENKGQGAFTYCLLETLKKNLDESKKFKNGTIKFRNVLKEVNCRLDLQYFDQNTQLSVSKKECFENSINL